jgi:hypothetical protein
LAFPSIFPASATLIEKHEKEKKEKKGLQETQRGRKAVSIDAAGSRDAEHRANLAGAKASITVAPCL